MEAEMDPWLFDVQSDSSEPDPGPESDLESFESVEDKPVKKAKVDNDENKIETENSAVSIDILNDDTLANVLSYLSITDLVRFERVSKRWRRLSQMLWRRIQKIDIKEDIGKRFSLQNLGCILKKGGQYLTHLGLPCDVNVPIKETFTTMNKYCKNLQHLSVTVSPRSPNDLNGISKYIAQNLKSLHVSCTGGEICDGMLSLIFKKAINLEEFSISSYAFRGSSLSKLSKKCKTLSIKNCFHVNKELLRDELENFPNLENLNISGNGRIGPSTLSSVSGQLISLELRGVEDFFWSIMGHTDDEFEYLTFENLRKVDFSQCFGIDIIFHSLIEKCPLLEDLALRGCNSIKDESFRQLKNLKNLVKLDVSFTKISDETLLYLASIHKFQNVGCFLCSNITEAGLKQLVDCSPELKRLQIGPVNKIGDDFFKCLLKCVDERSNHISLFTEVQHKAFEYIDDHDIYDDAMRLNLKERNDRPLKYNCCKVFFTPTKYVKKENRNKFWYASTSTTSPTNENED